SNELRFEDELDKQEVYLHAQKDLNTLVEHDQSTHIKHDVHLDVEHERFTRIKANEHLTVEGEQRTLVKEDVITQIEGSLQQKVAGKSILGAGSEIHFKAGQKVIIDAGAELTLKAGSHFIKIDPAGIHLVGAAVNLNAGGSAGSGSAFAGALAGLPRQVEGEATQAQQEAQMGTVKPSKVTIEPVRQTAAMKAAAEDNAPICQICSTPEGHI
ncbi:type VI secretion system tip protein VgrG, partial [Shewanella sp. MMG014]|nr:type VI secretion system tip protein VgrG [Shewanella sp. MMG014]